MLEATKHLMVNVNIFRPSAFRYKFKLGYLDGVIALEALAYNRSEAGSVWSIFV